MRQTMLSIIPGLTPRIRLSALCCLFVALPSLAQIESTPINSGHVETPKTIENTNISSDNVGNGINNALKADTASAINSAIELAPDATDDETNYNEATTTDSTIQNTLPPINPLVERFFNNSHTDPQLSLYKNAKQALDENRLANYQLMQTQLLSHPLYPHLQYSELIKRLKNLPYKEVDDFLFKHKDSYLAHRLLTKWLRQLAIKQHWHDYQSYYPLKHSATNNLATLNTTTDDADLVAINYRPPTDLKCFYLWSRIQTGEEQLLSETRSLWLVGRSQPDSCNRLFKQWQQEGNLTQELLWQRHYLAIKNKKIKLAQHLSSKMPKQQKNLAELLHKVYQQPEIILQTDKFSSTDPHMADIITYGLYRHAYYKPKKILQAFKYYQKNITFSPKEIQRLDDRITLNLIRREHQSLATKRMKKVPAIERVDNTERLLRELLKQQDWPTLLTWLQRLPKDLAQSNRWLYWQARAIEQTQDSEAELAQARAIYQTLSTKRSFYGFLAADKLQQMYVFEDNPAKIAERTRTALFNIPALHRAKALFNLEKMHLARQEWRYAIRDLSKSQLIAAGHLAHQWGWHRKAIEAMSAAKYWDDLSIRFPIVHAQLIHSAARNNAVAAPLVFAIARQESAWEFDARSRVGALGLMQIMPATATETARKAGISHHKEKLLNPQHNIAIGSYYISELLQRFNNNRILAIAAYNAGPHRVQRWLNKLDGPLPYDIWVEIIPFKETRRYVQNVLTYGVLYSHFNGRPMPLLTAAETNAAYDRGLL